MVNKTPDNLNSDGYLNSIYNAMQYGAESLHSAMQSPEVSQAVVNTAFNVAWTVANAATGGLLTTGKAIADCIYSHNEEQQKRLVEEHTLKHIGKGLQQQPDYIIRDGKSYYIGSKVKKEKEKSIKGIEKTVKQKQADRREENVKFAEDLTAQAVKGLGRAISPNIMAMAESASEMVQSVQEDDYIGAVSIGAQSLTGEIGEVSIKALEATAKAYQNNTGMGCEFKAKMLNIATEAIKKNVEKGITDRFIED